MARQPSGIFDVVKPKKKKAPQEWELVDKHGNRLLDETYEAKTAGEAALYLISRAGGWDVRKVDNGTA